MRTLTKREKTVADLILQDRSTKQIADELKLSPRTVDIHRRNILNKLGIPSYTQMVKERLQNNSAEVEDTRLS